MVMLRKGYENPGESDAPITSVWPKLHKIIPISFIVLVKELSISFIKAALKYKVKWTFCSTETYN